LLNLRFVRSHEGSPDADHTSRKLKRTMNKDLKDYVYLDGMWLQEKQLLKLAMNVGSYQMAEHYLCALLFDAVSKGKREVLPEVNKVREHYGVSPIPLSEEDLEDDRELRGKTRVTASDLQAKTLYLKMTREERIDVLRQSMKSLLSDYHLFIYARHWLGVFMVVRDRLVGESLNLNNFLPLASEFCPDSLPGKLRYNENTRKNIGREINEDDRGEVYYRMRRNPQQTLCDTFWEIVKDTIFTQKIRTIG